MTPGPFLLSLMGSRFRSHDRFVFSFKAALEIYRICLLGVRVPTDAVCTLD